MAARTSKAAVDNEVLFDKLRREVKAPAALRVTDEIVLSCPTKRQLEESQKDGLSEEESNRILIGDQYDALVALFDDQPAHLWVEFNKLYLEHFFELQSESKNS